MILKSPGIRLSLVVALLTVNLLLIANLLGLIPDVQQSKIELRKTLSESLALQFSTVAASGEFQIIQNTLREVVHQNNELLSAAIRRTDGELIALAGEHLAHWQGPRDGISTPTHIQIPVYRNKVKWADFELRYEPLKQSAASEIVESSFIRLLLFVGIVGFLCYLLVIKRTLRILNPSEVIPERVQRAFNMMREGVILLDTKERIVMVNNSFAQHIDKAPESLIGMKGSELGWYGYQTYEQFSHLPWNRILADGGEQESSFLSLADNGGRGSKFSVNATSISTDTGDCRGSLVTFDDITVIEEKNLELKDLVEKLEASQEEIKLKNQELEFLSTHDPLTMCLNRRGMKNKIDKLFLLHKRDNLNMSCLMLDIDHFKLVNDRYGHAVGDQVIKFVAEILKTSVGEDDLVARYGGEEFCVALPGSPKEKAADIADRIRRTVEKEECSGVKITISVGLSALEQQTHDFDDLVNKADNALYTAKNSGRNRVVVWEAEQSIEQKSQVEIDQSASVPLHSEISLEKLQGRIAELEGQLKKQSSEFQHFKMYDIKTGLPTRALFEDRLERELVRARRDGFLVAVLSISVSTIKRISETLGHTSAQRLVMSIVQTLNNALRENIDSVSVFETSDAIHSVTAFNQDELAVMLTDIQHVDDITWVVKRLLKVLGEPFNIEGEVIHVSSSIGISIFPYDGQTVEDIYSSALNACRFALENQVVNRYLFASGEINEQATRHLRIENLLHSAIEADELELYFQPKINPKTQNILRLEALLRWKSGQMGNISPADFIPISERSGQIDCLGDWVLYNACRQYRAWLDEGLEIDSIAVNVSGIQLSKKNLAKCIQDILKEFNLKPGNLDIELTESALVTIHDKNFTVLRQIMDHGHRIYMDDFGTGFSSLSYLKDVPLSGLKIDRSFVQGVGSGAGSEKLIASIVSMAKGFDLEVVAEGVETQEQADFLIACGCDYLQGYLFSRPVPANEVADFFQKKLAI